MGTDNLIKYWHIKIKGWELSEQGSDEIKRLVDRFTESEIREAMDVAARKYLRHKGDDLIESSNIKALKKIGGICYNRKHRGGV
jgi:hypothetical protein